ncbi:methyltransferase domain-containing protein [Pseudoponticoccus marisrubri]|uniref:Methyltransferase type 11 domain-containing protein n=1 Tax=Pseudoponticoccus marisrubri TaxID=1685382 RepID=A0A0W7WNL2_9RHOB|nr:methyltransferase domain-containing protein [Pseudoponticoccus marisrubri]KUF12197.1 hypothetical protein AVJ23_00210 [Pseudoponticoccus marisrubri]
MPDIYLQIADQPEGVIDAIAASMDARAAEPQMQAICARYMGGLPGPGAEVLELGCGNGASTAQLARHMAPSRLVGVDPSAALLARARARFDEGGPVSFRTGDVTQSALPAASVDVVVAHTVYSHIPDTGAALTEAWRVLRPGGTLAVFDGDYATNTVALFEGDPLQAAMQAVMRNLIHAPYVMRALPQAAMAQGFTSVTTEPFGYVQTAPATYLETLIGRGVDAARRAGEMGPALAEGFVAECRDRIAAGRFYGAILFLCLTARKPG